MDTKLKQSIEDSSLIQNSINNRLTWSSRINIILKIFLNLLWLQRKFEVCWQIVVSISNKSERRKLTSKNIQWIIKLPRSTCLITYSQWCLRRLCFPCLDILNFILAWLHFNNFPFTMLKLSSDDASSFKPFSKQESISERFIIECSQLWSKMNFLTSSKVLEKTIFFDLLQQQFRRRKIIWISARIFSIRAVLLENWKLKQKKMN